MIARSNITVSIDVDLVTRLRSIKNDSGIPLGYLTEQAISEFLDNHYPSADRFGITPSERESIKQASAAFGPLGKWDEPSGGSITAKSLDKQGRKIHYAGIYIDEIVTLHSVWIAGFEEKTYTLSDILTPDEFEQLNAVLTTGMIMYTEYRAARN